MGSPTQVDFKGTERFLIQRRLGSGGFGVVYQAYDRERNSLVALKTLQSANADDLYRFKCEFRALADVVHPNLVTLYELLSVGEQWFFTMELVDGVDFLEYVREGATLERVDFPSHLSTLKTRPRFDVETRQESEMERSSTGDTNMRGRSRAISSQLSFHPFALNLDRLRSVLRQLVEGICALHEAGQLHRDIKPSNVLVTREGRVVILDFGLVTELSPQRLKQSMEIIGTPEYMSPEHGAGLAISEASDWYSVGVMLYEALTWGLPFEGQPTEILMGKQRLDPLPPNELVSGLPEDLSALCVDLLRRNPKERPSGREALNRMGGVQAEALRPIPAVFSPMRAMPLIGRENHLTALMEAFQATRQGRPVTVYVQGRSGMGKSALVRRFLEELRQREQGVVVLEGRCYERESVPYKAMDSLVDALSQYLRGLSRLEAEALMPRDVLALACLFPVIQQVEAVAGAPRKVLEINDPQEFRRRAFVALRELLARLADRKPLVLFIDDLQWGDIDSAALLSELLRPPDPPVLLMIGSYRSEEVETSGFLKALLSSQTTTGSTVEVREVVVEELPATEARELAIALLDEKSTISMARAEVITQESGGNPFFIGELVRYSQTYAGAAQDEDAGAENTLDEVIHARVSQLPDDARRLLEVVAVSGQPLKRSVAKRAAELGADEQMLALLRTGHMIRATGASEEEIETYHDRIRETVVAHLSSETLKVHHHCLALALEASGRADPEMLTEHFQGAGDREKAAEYAVPAAEQASKALAFDRAARLYRLALELRSGEDSEARTLRVKLADALANSGRGAKAAQVYLVAAEGTSATVTIELQRRAAEQFLISGNIDEGLAVLRTVLGTVGMKLPETPQQALLSLLVKCAQNWLRGLRFRERDANQLSPDELIRIDTCWSAVLGLSMVDPIRGADFQARHLLFALKAGEPYRIARALAVEAGYSASSGGHSRLRSEKLLQMAMALAKRIDHPHALGMAIGAAGIAEFYAGRWKKCLELYERGERILRERCTGVTWELDTAFFFTLRSLFYMGELGEVFRRLPFLLKEVQERTDLYAETWLRLRISYIASLAADDPDRAREELRQAIMLWSQQGFHIQHFFELFGQIDIALYCGEGMVALKQIMDQWPALTRSFFLRTQITLIESHHLRARSALAAAVESNDPKLLLTAERDAHRIEREKIPWGDALALLIRAGIAASRKNTSDAVALLASAEKSFEAADMALYAAAARRRRGELIGGDQGRALVEAANAWMTGQNIKNPDRMTAMLAPGRWLI